MSTNSKKSVPSSNQPITDLYFENPGDKLTAQLILLQIYLQSNNEHMLESQHEELLGNYLHAMLDEMIGDVETIQKALKRLDGRSA